MCYRGAVLVLEQLLAGRDFATTDAAAAQMVNFVYLIADSHTKQALLVDPAWDVAGLIARVEGQGYTLVGVLVTHYHPDHAGGDLWGLQVEGAADLRGLRPVPVHAHRDEIPWLVRVTGLRADEISGHAGEDVLELDGVRVEFVHTPGHSPGSTCYLVRSADAAAGQPGSETTPALLTGDTLFVGSCGRIDLPGSDPSEMARTLTERLPSLPPGTIVYPGHDYGSKRTSTIETEIRTNPYMRTPP